jgi:bifunctional ADP-heptose synthase (sugar kinase/adenylyltransferase)
MSVGASLEIAATLANCAAGLVVGKLGTASINTEELADEVISAEERTRGTSIAHLRRAVSPAAEMEPVGFTN